MNIDYFISKFSSIPESHWCVGDVTDSEGRHDVYGHCGYGEGVSMEECAALTRIFKGRALPSEVNDGVGLHLRLGSTPKKRILKFLKMLKAGA